MLFFQFLRRELRVGRSGRVDHQALYVGYVSQEGEDLQVVDEGLCLGFASLDFRGKDGTAAQGEELLIEFVVGVFGQ